MARYRTKTAEDLAWNRVRRHLTRALDTTIQDRREEALNVLLDKAFDEFRSALQVGEIKEVEARYERFALEIVGDIVPEALGVGTGE